jgi:preprotein translocase subunit SecA
MVATLEKADLLWYSIVSMSFLKSIIGDESSKALKAMAPIVAAINAKESAVQGLSDDELKQKSVEFRERLAKGESIDSILPEAFAVVREVAKRLLGQRHYDVQLMGGLALHKGNISEMRTGEGKTLVATLPAYLNALTGKGVHVVTVNDYLSRRDGVWMGQIYSALGLSVGVITSDASYLYDPSHKETSDEDTERDELGSFKVMYDFLRPSSRRESYLADITYGTSNEFGFDYLRDNIAYQKNDLRQRGFHYAIVDEVDSILIDEARTPLIISAPAQASESLYGTFAKIAESLNADDDFELDEKHRSILMKDQGIEKAEKLLGIDNIYTDGGIKYVHHLETAVRAKALFHKDKEYVVRDNQIVIVDEFTGRLQPGRRWSEGLHQAVEAKEGVPVQNETRTFASVTFQNYFRMYEKLSGMTGTAATSSEEFQTVYNLETIIVPTNKPIARKDSDDLIFRTEKGKLKAIAHKVKELHEKGTPVLIGTASIEKNEMLGEYLSKEGVPHEILNAKNHEREGEIIAQAGQMKRVTIATNMAGRGVDIKLGGNPAPEEAYEAVKEKGGLFVLGTERHEARRIDNQLRGRAGRQGDPGETQFYVSLEDSLMRVFASDTIGSMMARLNIPEDEPIKNKLITRSLEAAQTKIEGFHFDSRKQILAYDDVLNHQRHSLYATRSRILLGEPDDVEAYLTEEIAGDPEATKIVEQKKSELGREGFIENFRRMALQTIDMFWMDHLEAMEYLRGSVNLRAYGQRDPLVEYRKEGLMLFRNLEEAIGLHIVRLLPSIGGQALIAEEKKMQKIEAQATLIGGASGASDAKQGGAHAKKTAKVGRNDMVTITDGTKTETMKFKKAEPLIESGAWKMV